VCVSERNAGIGRELVAANDRLLLGRVASHVCVQIASENLVPAFMTLPLPRHRRAPRSGW
jgi:hypothetical protein